MQEFFDIITKLDYPLVLIVLLTYAYSTHKERRVESEKLQAQITQVRKECGEFKSFAINELLKTTETTVETLTKLTEKVKNLKDKDPTKPKQN